MDTKNRQKKAIRRSKENDGKEPSNKTSASPIEDGEITLQVLEEDMPIIVADKIEENQPLLINDEDKPTNTSTPKRKAKDEQGAPTKKLIVEDVDHPKNDVKTSNKNAGEEKRAKEIIIERPKCHSCDEKFMKFIEEATKRIDNLEKSKQAEEEILNNSTQVIQETTEVSEKKKETEATHEKEESDDKTEDSDSDSNSDDYEKEELQATLAECEELKKKLNIEKGKNELAVKMIEQWEKDKKELEKEKPLKEEEYSRAVDDWQKSQLNNTSLKEKLKRMKTAANDYEQQIREASRKNEEKEARLAKLEQLNTRMEMVNNELERKVEMIAVAKRKSREEKQREDLMRKQLFETPTVDVPYFDDLKAKSVKI